jgi:hypothetical protein
VACGAGAAILPDALQFAYMRFPREPLISLQRFHCWIHASRDLNRRPVLGLTAQTGLVFLVLLIARAAPLECLLTAVASQRRRAPATAKTRAKLTIVTRGAQRPAQWSSARGGSASARGKSAGSQQREWASIILANRRCKQIYHDCLPPRGNLESLVKIGGVRRASIASTLRSAAGRPLLFAWGVLTVTKSARSRHAA